MGSKLDSSALSMDQHPYFEAPIATPRNPYLPAQARQDSQSTPIAWHETTGVIRQRGGPGSVGVGAQVGTSQGPTDGDAANAPHASFPVPVRAGGGGGGSYYSQSDQVAILTCLLWGEEGERLVEDTSGRESQGSRSTLRTE